MVFCIGVNCQRQPRQPTYSRALNLGLVIWVRLQPPESDPYRGRQRQHFPTIPNSSCLLSCEIVYFFQLFLARMCIELQLVQFELHESPQTQCWRGFADPVSLLSIGESTNQVERPSSFRTSQKAFRGDLRKFLPFDLPSLH